MQWWCIASCSQNRRSKQAPKLWGRNKLPCFAKDTSFAGQICLQNATSESGRECRFLALTLGTTNTPCISIRVVIVEVNLFENFSCDHSLKLHLFPMKRDEAAGHGVPTFAGSHSSCHLFKIQGVTLCPKSQKWFDDTCWGIVCDVWVSGILGADGFKAREISNCKHASQLHLRCCSYIRSTNLWQRHSL